MSTRRINQAVSRLERAIISLVSAQKYVGDDGCTESHPAESAEFRDAILDLIAEATAEEDY